MKIFLLAGKNESGKNEVAKLIKEHYVYNYKKSAITSFSKYIKNFVIELTEWDGNKLTANVSNIQDIGAVIRSINEDFLVDNMIKDMSIYEKYVDNVIIDDVKFPREIDKIRNDYDEVYVISVENQFKASEMSIDEQIDATELALESFTDFDYTIVNTTLEQLREDVFAMLEEIK